MCMPDRVRVCVIKIVWLLIKIVWLLISLEFLRVCVRVCVFMFMCMPDRVRVISL